ncbi:hypothetical protein C0Q70_11442 [Pomacea canaliculata]|uniref:Uncharacterized protein n=1 Tax=Pomacea canaliculata TaxID=400727 RepID=A0A2T7P604_POMCA|nr:hypothetical protein C0Q70_11442 [Pomacea canaliculata]
METYLLFLKLDDKNSAAWEPWVVFSPEHSEIRADLPPRRSFEIAVLKPSRRDLKQILQVGQEWAWVCITDYWMVRDDDNVPRAVTCQPHETYTAPPPPPRHSCPGQSTRMVSRGRKCDVYRR